ncbi:TIGR04028 family ABC transporter substrate-binding protein [Klebsiella pneumoniae]|uniref:TIGR04028 family ABC transporter substrate-binding protein n=19 Tax=Gammaproteobacteria TaxID=1236 RepID=UPI000E2AA5BD|nr:ABC-type dipeptide transport system [Klebsiella pneumoniae]
MHRHFRLPALAALFLTGAFSVWAADTPVKGGTLIYLEQQPHTNLYPPAGGFYPNGGILNQITDKLTWQNPKTLEIEPWIAESWTSNADKTEYTFHLRKGVTFSDGTPLDAAAVAKNFDTYGLGDKAHRLPVSEVINNYQRSEVIDPLTVKFYFNKPSPGFLQGTATIGSGLVSLSTLQRNFEELGDARHIIGSGPFVVQDEKPGRELTLVARKDYQWGPKNIAQQGPANLDGITYIVTPEDSVRIGALLAGQAGFIRQVQAYDEKQATDQGFKIYAAPTRGVNDSLSFRPDNPLVADLRVRQALLHATNAKELGDARHIIGSGPFVVQDEKPGRELTLVARKDYQWGPKNIAQQGPANLDGITYIVTPEDSVRIGALLAGQAGFIRQVQAYDEKQATDQGFKIYAAPTRGVNDSLSFRPDNPLVADLRVRQALLHATNARQVVETLFSANYPQATSVLASSAAGYVNLSDKLTFDQAKTRQLLDDAGWKPAADGIRSKDGQRLALTVYESLPQPQNKEVLQLIAQQWSQVGVALTVKAGDAGSRTLDNLDPQKTPLTVSEVGRADPDVVKSMFFPNNRDALLQKGGSSDKVQRFRDDKLNDLLTGISAAVEPQQRLQLTGDAQRYLIDNAYVIPIFEEPQVFAGAPWVKGVSFEAVGRPSFYGAWLDKH